MLDRTDDVGRTGKVVALVDLGFALLDKRKLGRADRAPLRRLYLLLRTVAELADEGCYFRDHISGAAHIDAVSDHKPLFANHADVVKRSPFDDDTADLDRFKFCNRSDDAEAAHLPGHTKKSGRLFDCRKLVGDRPPGSFGQKSGSKLLGKFVQFDDKTVDIVRQISPFRDFFINNFTNLLYFIDFSEVRRRKSKPPEKSVKFLLFCERQIAYAGYRICKKLEFSFGCDPGIKLPERARRRVPRVCKELLAAYLLHAVKLFKALLRHIDFAPDFDSLSIAKLRDVEPDTLYRCNIFRNVFTDLTVSAGRRHGESAVII